MSITQQKIKNCFSKFENLFTDRHMRNHMRKLKTSRLNGVTKFQKTDIQTNKHTTEHT